MDSPGSVNSQYQLRSRSQPVYQGNEICAPAPKRTRAIDLDSGSVSSRAICPVSAPNLSIACKPDPTMHTWSNEAPLFCPCLDFPDLKWGPLRIYYRDELLALSSDVRLSIKQQIKKYISADTQTRKQWLESRLKPGQYRGSQFPMLVNEDEVRAARDIEPFELLGHYAGVCMTLKSLEQACHEYGYDTIGRYQMDFNRAYSISGFRSGNICSLINANTAYEQELHGNSLPVDTIEPNVIAVVATRSREIYVFLISLTDIPENSAIWMDYGIEYWKIVSEPCDLTDDIDEDEEDSSSQHSSETSSDSTSLYTVSETAWDDLNPLSQDQITDEVDQMILQELEHSIKYGRNLCITAFRVNRILFKKGLAPNCTAINIFQYALDKTDLESLSRLLPSHIAFPIMRAYPDLIDPYINHLWQSDSNFNTFMKHAEKELPSFKSPTGSSWRYTDLLFLSSSLANTLKRLSMEDIDIIMNNAVAQKRNSTSRLLLAAHVNEEALKAFIAASLKSGDLEVVRQDIMSNESLMSCWGDGINIIFDSHTEQLPDDQSASHSPPEHAMTPEPANHHAACPQMCSSRKRPCEPPGDFDEQDVPQPRLKTARTTAPKRKQVARKSVKHHAKARKSTTSTPAGEVPQRSGQAQQDTALERGFHYIQPDILYKKVTISLEQGRKENLSMSDISRRLSGKLKAKNRPNWSCNACHLYFYVEQKQLLLEGEKYKYMPVEIAINRAQRNPDILDEFLVDVWRNNRSFKKFYSVARGMLAQLKLSTDEAWRAADAIHVSPGLNETLKNTSRQEIEAVFEKACAKKQTDTAYQRLYLLAHVHDYALVLYVEFLISAENYDLYNACYRIKKDGLPVRPCLGDEWSSEGLFIFCYRVLNNDDSLPERHSLFLKNLIKQMPIEACKYFSADKKEYEKMLGRVINDWIEKQKKLSNLSQKFSAAHIKPPSGYDNWHGGAYAYILKKQTPHTSFFKKSIHDLFSEYTDSKTSTMERIDLGLEFEIRAILEEPSALASFVRAKLHIGVENKDVARSLRGIGIKCPVGSKVWSADSIDDYIESLEQEPILTE